MTPGNDHMRVEEFLRVLHAHARPGQDAVEPELEEHLRQCKRCSQMLKEYQRFMSKLYEFGRAEQADGKCPDAGVWGELASGIMSQEEAASLLKHAASCQSCVEELLNALEVLGSNDPAPEELQRSLATATAGWQKRFAANIASRQSPSQIQIRKVPPSRKGWHLLSRSWAYMGVAALLILTIGIGLYSWLRGSSSEALIQEAYAQQRTVEMRLPGARYGPIQVQRADGRSQTSSPRALLEAEVLIKRGLENKPDDADLLRQKAEADLLTWNYQPALETLNHAARLKSSSFELLVDTATAYFERAEATANPADYEAGLQSLGDAIRIKPDDPAALFNRAIIYERLYFYSRAIADWEEFLKIEKDPEWRKEAEQRLREIRERQQQHSSWSDPARLTVAQFKHDVTNPGLAAIEEYVKVAEQKILPQASGRTANSEDQAATALAGVLQARHSDRFLKDLLAASTNPQFHAAIRALGQSSSANAAGHYDEAYSAALQSTALFRKLGNTGGVLSAQFEQAYALQFESRARPCRELAAQAAAEAHAQGYFLLEIQLLLEQSTCSNMDGELGQAKELDQRVLTLAKAHDYQVSYLRGLVLWAVLESDAGDDSSAWATIHDGLRLYWDSALPPVRAYSLYSALDEMAERTGHAHVRFAALFEALSLRKGNPNRMLEASARARLGDVALRIGELQVAQEQFAQAANIFAMLPVSDSTRWRELEARINLARVQLLQNSATGGAVTALLAALPVVQQLSNRYLEFQYYDTLADLKLRAGDVAAARDFLEKAIAISETGAQSLATWRERSAWMDQQRHPFALMTELLFQAGQEKRALEMWETFRAAGIPHTPGSLPFPAGAFLGNGNPAGPQPWVITYGFGDHGLMIWLRHWTELHSAHVPVLYRDLQRTIEMFLSECSRPDSDLKDLQADGQSLYQWLIQPVRRWLPQSGHLVIEPDGLLSGVPFEPLVDSSGDYLGSQYAITVAPAMQANPSARVQAIASSDSVVIVAAPAGGQEGRLAPPPGTLAEARAVAADFEHPEMLLGRDANMARVQHALAGSNIFHFAGHASSGRTGAAMLMADGFLDSMRADVFAGQNLKAVKLAMFSACATARPGEISGSSSLVSEFLHAGAQNVVASRWNVDSLATTDFARAFYSSVLSGRSVAEALQAAANDFRKTPSRMHPYYWAAFSAFGGA